MNKNTSYQKLLAKYNKCKLFSTKVQRLILDSGSNELKVKLYDLILETFGKI